MAELKLKNGFSNRNFITINGNDYMYNRSKEISDTLYKHILQNIPYEADDQVFKRVRLNTKTRVIQNFLKKKAAVIKEKKILAVNKIINYLRRNPKLIITNVAEALRGKVKMLSVKPKILGASITSIDLPFLVFQSYKHVLKKVNTIISVSVVLLMLS